MVTRPKHPRADELAGLASIVDGISGYCPEIASSIVNVELRRLEQETLADELRRYDGDWQAL